MPCELKPLEPAMQSVSKTATPQGGLFPLTISLEPHTDSYRVTFSHDPNGTLNGGPPYVDITSADTSVALKFRVDPNTTSTSVTVKATCGDSTMTAQVLITP